MQPRMLESNSRCNQGYLTLKIFHDVTQCNDVTLCNDVTQCNDMNKCVFDDFF